jgi:hypothetical protein
VKIKFTRDHTLGKKGQIVDVEYQYGARLLNHGLAVSPSAAERDPAPPVTVAPGVEVLGKPTEKAFREPSSVPLSRPTSTSASKTPSLGSRFRGKTLR